MPKRLRRRLCELEARVAALETVAPAVSYDMPPRPTIGVACVDTHGLWADRVAEYATGCELEPSCQPGVYA